MKLENIRDHEHRKCHTACVCVLGSIGASLFYTCDGANSNVKADEHKYEILFWIVHAIGKEAKPLSDFEEMCE